MVKVIIPESLERFTNEKIIFLSLDKLSDFPSVLKVMLPKLYAVIYQSGELHGFVNLYINDELVFDHADRSLNEDDTIELITSVSGG